jgi:hypothetical protein
MNNSEDLAQLLATAEAARAEFDAAASAVPMHTIVMPGRTLAPQDWPARPVPAPAPAPVARPVPFGGRQRFSDPSDPRQLHAIAKRMPTFVVWEGQEIGPVPFTRLKATLLRAKGWENRVNARILSENGQDRLVLGGL